MLNRSASSGQGKASDAQNQAHELANSDRIRLKFGACGIDVLENGPNIRVSVLYSPHDDVQICRTFAVVVYPDTIAPALSKEHGAVLGGQPIGQVFRENGWLIDKRHQYFGRLEALAGGPGSHPAFGDIGGTQPAVHVYSFVVSKNNEAFHYASIAEVHHPEHLRFEDLMAIYGDRCEAHLEAKTDIYDILEIVEAKLTSLPERM